MFPYKIAWVQHRQDGDKVAQVAFSEWCKVQMLTDLSFLRLTMISDECIFHVSGIANTQNIRFWLTELPRAV